MLNSSFIDIDSTETVESQIQIEMSDETQLNKSTVNNTNEFVLEDHCHTGLLHKDTNKIVRRKLSIVLILCVLFMTGEIIGGLLAHSISIQTDAAHMAADIAGFFFSLLAIFVSKKSLTHVYHCTH
jgi:Co/Zn/Cd efflux system component